MSSTVVYLHRPPAPLTPFLRVGSSGHRHLEQLLLSGRLPFSRIVIEAASFQKQSDLVAGLQTHGRELILDTNVAELSAPGKFEGAARAAPGANPDGVLTPAHLSGANELDVIGRIARFAVENSIQRVLAPTHMLHNGQDAWFRIDLRACNSLRRHLDVEGGKNIAIDYPLLITNAVLNDAAERRAFVTALRDAPVESLWLRISGFGAGATPAALRKYITACQDFHALSLPLVADGVGGTVALAIISFGAACGVAHGAAEKERFDARDWSKPREVGSGGGGGRMVLLAGIDRLLKKEEAQALVSASGGRRLLSCNDPTCCPGGFEDTLKDPRAHYLRQRAFQCEALSAVPEPRRTQHFLDTTMADIDRKARQVAKLKLQDDKLDTILTKNSERLDKMRAVLEDLNRTGGILKHAVPFPASRALGHITRTHGRS